MLFNQAFLSCKITLKQRFRNGMDWKWTLHSSTKHIVPELIQVINHGKVCLVLALEEKCQMGHRKAFHCLSNQCNYQSSLPEKAPE